LGAAALAAVSALASRRLPGLWGVASPFSSLLPSSSDAGGKYSADSFLLPFHRLLVLLFLDEAAELPCREDLLVLMLRLLADADFRLCLRRVRFETGDVPSAVGAGLGDAEVIGEPGASSPYDA